MLSCFHILLSISVVFNMNAFVCVQMEALAYLSVSQLVALSTKPGQLTSPDQVTMVMKHVPDQMLANFFDEFSVAITVSKPLTLTVKYSLGSGIIIK